LIGELIAQWRDTGQSLLFEELIAQWRDNAQNGAKQSGRQNLRSNTGSRQWSAAAQKRALAANRSCKQSMFESQNRFLQWLAAQGFYTEASGDFTFFQEKDPRNGPDNHTCFVDF